MAYRPNTSAQNLKLKTSNTVFVVLPNITDSKYGQIFTAIHQKMSGLGFRVVLEVTEGLAIRERDILLGAQSMKATGIFIITCAPENAQLFQLLLDQGIKLVFIEREPGKLECNFVGYDYSRALKGMLQPYKNKKVLLTTENHAYSQEKAIRDGVEAGLHTSCALDIVQDISGAEAAFKTVLPFFLERAPDVVLATNTLLLEGILKAADFCKSADPELIAVCGESWSDHRYQNVQKIQTPAIKLGAKAAEILFENIGNPAFFDVRKEIIPLYEPAGRNTMKTKAPPQTLHLAMLEGPAAHTMRRFAPRLEQDCGIRLTVDEFVYEELYAVIVKEAEKDRYDIFSIDLPWLRAFAKNDMLYDLAGCAQACLPEIFDELVEDFSRVDETHFAIPYSFCNQTLFYRKSLFDSIKNQRLFYEQYGSELMPPSTWSEFNAVAKFFTRAYNKESETLYGTTAGGKYSSAAMCEFLPRLWAFRGDVFDHRGDVVLDSFQTLQALQNYCETFLYASPDSPEHWWNEQAAEFYSGKAAMMVLYSSHAVDIVDQSKSSIIGDIGMAHIPGGIAVNGGWSFGINNRSNQKEAALHFLQWLCHAEILYPATVMGGFDACRKLYTDSEFLSVYPWYALSRGAYRRNRSRTLPPCCEEGIGNIKQYETIIGDMVHSTVIGKTKPDKAIEKAAQALQKLVNGL